MGDSHKVAEGGIAVTPHLVVGGAEAAIEFYGRAFGAVESFRMPGPDGKIMFAELVMGGSKVYLCDEVPEHNRKGPAALGNTPVTIHLQVADADAAFNRAVDAGATVAMPLEDMFWGDRFGYVIDPFGHHWSIASKKEDLTPEQMQERMASMFATAGTAACN